MRGLYDGLEEVAFKRTDGGWVFQTSNPWLFGPRKRFFVTESQKTAIAARQRETLRRLKPFAFGYAILLPFVIVALVWALAQAGRVLTLTVKEPTGESISTTQTVGLFGARGVLAAAAGTMVVYRVEGLLFADDKLVLTTLDAAGKSANPTVVSFVDGAAVTVNFADAEGHVARTAIFVAGPGIAPGAFEIGLALAVIALLGPLFVAPHVYGYRRLRSLLADLPRTRERITWRDNAAGLAEHASGKMLAVMFIGPAFAFAVDALILITPWFGSHPSSDPRLAIFGAAVSALSLIWFGYLAMLRRKARGRSLQR